MHDEVVPSFKCSVCVRRLDFGFFLGGGGGGGGCAIELKGKG